MTKFRKKILHSVWGLFVPSKSYKLSDQKKSEISGHPNLAIKRAKLYFKNVKYFFHFYTDLLR